MKKACVLALGVALIASCKPSKKDMITKRWQAIKVESAELERQIAESRIFFDTVGKSTDAATNLSLYGVANMDSMRVILKMQLDSVVTMQEKTVQNTWMHFFNDSTLVTSFDTPPDTVKWYFDDDGNIMLDELAQAGVGAKIKMEVVKLDDTSLHLRFNENGFSSLAIFVPASEK